VHPHTQVRAAQPLTFRLTRHIAEALRTETVGGSIMLLAAVVALVWANSGWAGGYRTFQGATFGPSVLHLHLSAAAWAADGLLALFFFIAGMEVKREFVTGELSSPRKAALPVIAALSGMVVPAAAFLIVSAGTPGAHRGWAIPMATDIAFALAVLAVVGSAFPPALRIFLLTLAVVDDLGAIVVIAAVYTATLAIVPLVAAVGCLAMYAWLQHRRVRAWWLYVPLALATWGFVHASGIHATVAGVALGLLTRVRLDEGEADSPADRLDHMLRPLSAGVAVPLFALLAAGVPFGADALGSVFTDRIGLGIVVGLVVGKLVGVLGGSYLAVRLGLARLSDELAWRDMACLAILTGVGFTVSLLICDLAYAGMPVDGTAKAAVLLASLIASFLAAVLLRRRGRVHRNARFVAG
jgi:NhaA family Na+:H+ antiporter